MTHLKIKNQNSNIEIIDKSLVTKLYQEAKLIKDYEELNEIEESQIDLVGNLQTTKAYGDEIDWLETNFPNLHINATGKYIRFADSNVESILTTNYGDGVGVTVAEAGAATNTYDNFREYFFENANITSFNELKYFTNATHLKYDTFSNCTNLESVDLLNVTWVDLNVFYECPKLKTILNYLNVLKWGKDNFSSCDLTGDYDFSGSVLENGENKQLSFINNTHLTSVALPSGSTHIKSFQGCTSLQAVTNTNNITSIGYEAFRDCTSLKSVSFPNLVTLNYANTFYGSGLESISLPSLTSITEQHMFRDCTSLTSVSLPNLTTSPGWNNRGSTFYNCTSLTQISLPLLTNICHSMFYHCTSLSSVSIPSCTSIGNNAFENCPITQLPCSQSNIKRLGEGTFRGCSNLGLGVTLELNLTLLTSKLLNTFLETKFKKLILHWPNALDDYFDGRYLIWNSMTQLEYIDMSDTITQGLAANHSQKTYSLLLNYALETVILPSDINYLTTGIMSVDSNYTSYKYLILLSTTPPDILIDSNNPRNRFFARSTLLHIYVPDSVLQDYLSDTNWLQLGDGTSNFDLSTRVHGLSELPNGVWTTGLASLYLTPALLATS